MEFFILAMQHICFKLSVPRASRLLDLVKFLTTDAALAMLTRNQDIRKASFPGLMHAQSKFINLIQVEIMNLRQNAGPGEATEGMARQAPTPTPASRASFAVIDCGER